MSICRGRVVAAVAIAVVALSSCSSPLTSRNPEASSQKNQSTGAVEVTIAMGLAGQSVVPDISASVVEYVVTLSRSDYDSLTRTGTESVLQIEDLADGEWDVVVSARNGSGDTVAQGSGSVLVKADETSSTVVTLSRLDAGKGTIDVTVTWPADSINGVQSATLGTQEGTTIDVAGKAELSEDEWSLLGKWDSGVYTLNTQFTRDGSHVATVLESIHVFPNVPAEARIELTDSEIGQPPTGPDPAQFRVSALDATTVEVTWTDDSDVESGYELRRSDNGDWSTYETALLGYNVSSYVDTEVQQDTSYSYRIVAYNDFGEAHVKPLASVRTPLASPSNLATDPQATTVSLQWTDNADSETGFSVYRSTTAGGGYAKIGSTPTDDTDFVDTDVNENTTYYYVVTADNSYGPSPYSEEVSATTPGWKTEAIDETGNVGRENAVAVGDCLLDGDFTVRVIYSDDTNAAVRYIESDGSDWNGLENAAGGDFVDASSSLAFDGGMALSECTDPVVSYYDNANGDLKYAAWNGSEWSTTVVDSTGDVGAASDIYTSGSFMSVEVGISYFDDTNNNVKFARFNGLGGWSTEIVDNSFYTTGRDTSVAYGDSTVHISYNSSQSGNTLMYASNNGGGEWVGRETSGAPDVVDSGGRSISIRLYGSTVHISHYDPSANDLKYARHDGTNWHTEIVDSDGDVGVGSSIDVYDGDVYISYVDRDENALKLAKKLGGGPWQVETIDTAAAVSGDTSIGIDENGGEQIVYFDDTNDELRHARYGF